MKNLYLKNFDFRAEKKLPGTIITNHKGIVLVGYKELEEQVKDEIKAIVNKSYEKVRIIDQHGQDLIIYKKIFEDRRDLIEELGKSISQHGLFVNNIIHKRLINNPILIKGEKIDFKKVKKNAESFANFLKKNVEEIAGSVNDYETYSTAKDEIDRSIDLLTNLSKNEEYFRNKINKVVTFLPLNQPLYATVCFAIIPSLMADKVYVRPPSNLHFSYKKLVDVIKLSKHFKNIEVRYQDKEEYLRDHKMDTDVLIFTGKKENLDIIRKKIKAKLCILNGSGHNPIVVTKTGNIDKAVDSVIRVTMQNQGQDCAAPSAILVDKAILSEFRKKLLRKLDGLRTKIGDYANKKNIIGPNTDPNHVQKIVEFLSHNRKYCIYGGVVNPINGMIYPTVLIKDLADGPNYFEFFSPVVMIQPFDDDNELKLYFETKKYFKNAMYVCLYGESKYVDSLIEKKLHTNENILRNTDLHIQERGFIQYGGLGPAASCVYFLDEMIPGATLPQRDIYRYLVSNAVNK